MVRLSQEDRALLDDLIKENGSDKVKDYISRNFTPTVIKIRRITPVNAHEWIDLSAFAAWLVDDCQKRLRGPTPPRDPAPPDVEKQRPTDVQQPRPTEVQQPRIAEVQQPQATEVQQPQATEVQQPQAAGIESTPRPPSLLLSMYRQLQKRGRPSYLEDVAAHPESDDPLTTGDSGARELRNRKRQHTSFFDEEDSRQASSSQNSRLTTSIGHSGSSQDTDKPFDVPCSYCRQRGIPCMPQKGVYRTMACFQCSSVRIHCSHVPASRGGTPAHIPFVVPSSLQRRIPGNWRTTLRSDAGPPKSVSSGPWLSSPGATRKIKINGKRVEIAK